MSLFPVPKIHVFLKLTLGALEYLEVEIMPLVLSHSVP